MISKYKYIKIIVNIIAVCFILGSMTACSKKPPTPLKDSEVVDIIKENIKAMNEKARDSTTTFSKIIKRDTVDTTDKVDYEVKTVERTGFRINYSPLETKIKTVSRYTAKFVFTKGTSGEKDKWNVESIDKGKDTDCSPLEGVAVKQFAVQKYNYDFHDENTKTPKQITDLKQGIDQILIKQAVKSNLVDRIGTTECNFKFNKELRSWEWTEAVEQDDWETNYKITGRWYLAENVAATKSVYLDIESVEDGVLKATYNYIDKLDVDQCVDIKWEGTAQEDNAFVFSSKEDDIVLSIPNNGKGDTIEFEGHIFKPYK